MRLQSPGILHLSDLSRLLFNGKLVEGERRCLVLDLQIPLIDPHGHIFPDQPQFAIKAPVLEFHEAVTINLARELRGVQRSREYFFREGPAHYPPEYPIRAVSSSLSLQVGSMMLSVVVDPPGPVRLLDFRPGACFGERVIG